MSNSRRDLILSLLADPENILLRSWTTEKLLDQLSSSSSSDDSSSDESEDPEEHEKEENFMAVIDSYGESDFKTHMRMRRTTVDFLIERLSSSTTPKTNGGGKPMLDCKLKIYMYIWYITNTVTYKQLGDLFGVAKSTAWTVVNNVTSWMISIGHEYIKWPQGPAAEETKMKFKAMKNIPDVIGAIGCIHIHIKAPQANKENYFDGKRNYSLILQGVFDANKRFTDITCGEPGSLHNSRVLRRSDLYNRIQTDCEALFPNGSFILGDAAYQSTSWLVSPFKDDGNLTEQQRKFNQLHSSTRIIVENAFGLLKTRFRRLLHFTEQNDICCVVNIVVSACILHNICITFDDLNIEVVKDYLPEESQEQEEDEDEIHNNETRRDTLFRFLQEEHII